MLDRRCERWPGLLSEGFRLVLGASLGRGRGVLAGGQGQGRAEKDLLEGAVLGQG